MPFDDWQFWVVTLVAVAGVFFVVRPLLKRRRRRSQRVKLTLENRPIDR